MNLQELQTPESFENGSLRNVVPSGRALLSRLERRRFQRRAAKLWKDALTPPKDRTPIEWAEENYRLPKGSAEPGMFRSARTPYLAPMFEALRKYRKIVAIMGSQMAKTTGFFIVIGQKLDDDPAPILYVGPTKSNVDSAIEPRISQMLRSSASLWAKTEKGRAAKKLVKRVAGVTLSLAWAGSPTELASRPAHTVLIDELDRMEPIAGEGDPVSLAEARMATYPDGRLLITSTPIEGNVEVARHEKTGIEHWKLAKVEDLLSPVWKLWQEGTRFEWAVPCPHCQQYFIPRFALLKWPEKCGAQRALKEAWLACQRCGACIYDNDKSAMNAKGVFIAPGQDVVDGQAVGEIPETDTASFWASGIMSPWRTFGGMAAKWIRTIASGDQERIRAVINTDFGELYAFRGEAQPPDVVRACAANYLLGSVPPGRIDALTCFVDVQKSRLIYAVRGWGLSMESWLIDCGEIWGETGEPAIWSQLEDLLERDYGAMRILLMGIDSGYRPGDRFRRPDNLIYEFCMRHRGRAIATKGRERLEKPLSMSKIDVTMRGQVYKQGLDLWHLDTDYFKSWLMARLVWPEGQPGRWWVPEDVSDDYCLQVTAETRIAKPSGAAIWVKVRSENHFLDCEAGNVALAQVLGFHRRLATPEKMPATESGTVEAPAPPPAPKPFRPAPMMAQGFPRAGNWTKNWRR